MRFTAPFITLGLVALARAAISSRLGPSSPQHINAWLIEAKAKELEAARHPAKASPLVLQDPQAAFVVEQQHKSKYPEFPEQFFEQPIDHSDPSQGTFKQRYWVNARHYVHGSNGPVIVLDGGETSGEDRLPFLDTGIVEILANATGGVGVVLEHRYYGTSIPVPDFSTDNLRWLNNEQAAADSANFMRNVKFSGIDANLTAPHTPWIYYGGSYAGARAAHMKVLYPDIVFGAIASSGVTHASIANWEYFDVIRLSADPVCSAHIQNAISTVDSLLGIGLFKNLVKRLFGLRDLKHDGDFASVLMTPLEYWQSKNWDPNVGSTKFDEFCEFLKKPLIGRSEIAALPIGHDDRLVTLMDNLKIDFSVVNYAKWIKAHQVEPCLESNTTVEDCFGTYDDAKYNKTSLDQTWRLWQFQVCTQWGYFSSAPLDPTYPRIVSKLLTPLYSMKICGQAFPPGKHFRIPGRPRIRSVNALGDFAIAADRLAIIDGEVDPWRPCTPHSVYAKDRNDTIIQPFKLIPEGVHHYDEYGLRNINDEPPEIQKIHHETIDFVRQWLKDFKA